MITKIKEIIAEELGLEISEVTDTANIIDDLYADSLGVMQIAMEIEEAFDILIPQEKLLEVKTAQDIEKIVKENQK